MKIFVKSENGSYNLIKWPKQSHRKLSEQKFDFVKSNQRNVVGVNLLDNPH